MRKYVIKPGVRGMFSLDTEAENCDIVEPIRSHIDWIYSIPEDGVMKSLSDSTSSTNDEMKVKAGDLVIAFYNAPYTKNQFVVISSKEWKENMDLERSMDQKTCDCECTDTAEG